MVLDGLHIGSGHLKSGKRRNSMAGQPRAVGRTHHETDRNFLRKSASSKKEKFANSYIIEFYELFLNAADRDRTGTVYSTEGF